MTTPPGSASATLLQDKNSVVQPEARSVASEFLDFVNRTGSPYHSVLECRDALLKSGFESLSDDRPWPSLQQGKGYFVHRNFSSIMAFVVGGQFRQQSLDEISKRAAARGGFLISAAHTDSPCLRVRPRSDTSSNRARILSCETYGGGLWHTWMDRGLGLAGKVVALERVAGGSGQAPAPMVELFVRIPRPVTIIPNLAIHMLTGEELAAFKLDTETQLRPIMCTSAAPPASVKVDAERKSMSDAESPWEPLRRLLADQLGSQHEVVATDLCLMDATPGRFAGMFDEFVEAGRLDNQVSVFAGLRAICSLDTETVAESPDVFVFVAFDHEEVGSVSFNGADSCLLQSWLERIIEAVQIVAPNHAAPSNVLAALISRSFLLSTDGAHAVHPNYAEKHQSEHKPYLQCGVVLKENSNQRYTSQGSTMALARQLSDPNNCPIQDMVVKNTSRCGSTIGPCTAARLGIRAVDVGAPQWAMHSIRETCGVNDIFYLRNFIQRFFRNFRLIDKTIALI